MKPPEGLGTKANTWPVFKTKLQIFFTAFCYSFDFLLYAFPQHFKYVFHVLYTCTFFFFPYSQKHSELCLCWQVVCISSERRGEEEWSHTWRKGGYPVSLIYTWCKPSFGWVLDTAWSTHISSWENKEEQEFDHLHLKFSLLLFILWFGSHLWVLTHLINTINYLSIQR